MFDCALLSQQVTGHLGHMPFRPRDAVGVQAVWRFRSPVIAPLFLAVRASRITLSGWLASGTCHNVYIVFMMAVKRLRLPTLVAQKPEFTYMITFIKLSSNCTAN